MNRRTVLAAVFGALLLAIAPVVAPVVAPPAVAHDYRLGDLVIDHPWTRATPAGAPVAGGFFKVRNTGKAADRLVSGTSEVAGTFEIHEMAVVDGIMKMRPLAKGIEIPPGGEVVLKPGGLHVMFIGLASPLKEGAKVRGTLVFEKAGKIEVEYTVEAIAAGSSTTGHGEHKMH